MFGYDMVLPMNTGAEAVETAIKLSRKWGYMKKGIQEGRERVLSVKVISMEEQLALSGTSTEGCSVRTLM